MPLGHDRGERRALGEQRLVEHGDQVPGSFGDACQQFRLEHLRAGEDQMAAGREVGESFPVERR